MRRTYRDKRTNMNPARCPVQDSMTNWRICRNRHHGHFDSGASICTWYESARHICAVYDPIESKFSHPITREQVSQAAR